MIQVINRPEQSVEKTNICGANPQISFNSDGRLVVRMLDGNGGDKLVIFSELASIRIIDFCQTRLAKQRMEPGDDIPF